MGELSACEYHCIRAGRAESRFPSFNLLSRSSVGTMDKGTGIMPRGSQRGSGDRDSRQVNTQRRRVCRMTQPCRRPVVQW